MVFVSKGIGEKTLWYMILKNTAQAHELLSNMASYLKLR
jgi:hypothetical protein